MTGDRHNGRTVATIAAACDEIAKCEIAPELMLVAYGLPGDVRQADVDRLQHLAPLARIVIVASSWCEGELRTGRPLAGVVRLYWYELVPWWLANERRLAGGLAPTWSAPLDHPQSGRLAVAGAIIDLPRTAVHADDYSVYKCLSDASVPAVWTRGERVAAEAGVFDGGQLSERELERLDRFCQQIPGPVVVLLDFPRVEHIEQAQAAGAATVFSKPYVVEEVLAALVS